MIRPTQLGSAVQRFPALTPTLPPATHTNSYALGERDVLLVEPATPYEDEAREWLAWARGLQTQGRRLVAIFATHHHADHITGSTLFETELGLPLWAHTATSGLLGGRRIDRTFDGGESISLDGPTPTSWDVLHTPGHASDHLCLHERSRRILVIGDMVASVGTILVPPGDGDMAEYLRQLRRLEGLSANVALPAHGDPIEEPSKLLRAYCAHRLMRESWILKALGASGGGTLDELVPLAYADTPPEIHPIARLSLEAHLIKCVSDGKVARDGDRYLLRT